VNACIEDPVVIQKMLTHLNEQTPFAEAIPLLDSRAPPHIQLDFAAISAKSDANSGSITVDFKEKGVYTSGG